MVKNNWESSYAIRFPIENITLYTLYTSFLVHTRNVGY